MARDGRRSSVRFGLKADRPPSEINGGMQTSHGWRYGSHFKYERESIGCRTVRFTNGPQGIIEVCARLMKSQSVGIVGRHHALALTLERPRAPA